MNQEIIVVSFVFSDLDNLDDRYPEWDCPLVTYDNLQEFIHFITNMSVDIALEHGAKLNLDMSTWCYRKLSDFDLKVINENLVFNPDVMFTRDYVSEFVEMANSSETPSDYYYDSQICTALIYDAEEDAWYENDIPCYCDECMLRDQKYFDQLED